LLQFKLISLIIFIMKKNIILSTCAFCTFALYQPKVTNKTIDINETHIQKQEVEYMKYMSVEEIKELKETGQMLKSHGIMFNELMKKKHN